MSSDLQIHCDRCGKRIVEPKGMVLQIASRHKIGKMYHRDLCDSCFDKFEDFVGG